MKLYLVSAICENGGIGLDNALPWHVPEDMMRFKQITSGHTVVMGKNTFESIGKPLSNRKNVVVTHNPDVKRDQDNLIFRCMDDTELYLESLNDEALVFVIGGPSLYEHFWPVAYGAYITRIHKAYRCDTFFPESIPLLTTSKRVIKSSVMRSKNTNVPYTFETYMHDA